MRKNNQHITVENLFALYRGELDLEQINRYMSHIDECDECSSAFEAMKAFEDAELRQPSVEYAEKQLDEKLLNITKQYIQTLQKNNYAKKFRGHFYENGWRYLAAVAASLLLITFVEFILPQKHNPMAWVRIISTEIESNYGEIRASDSLTLIAFYDATHGRDWTNTWNLSAPMDTWYGVVLSEYGSVESLHLACNNLKGTIPKEIGNLSGLKFLLLNDNHLTGRIPHSIHDLELTHLSFRNNPLTCYVSNVVKSCEKAPNDINISMKNSLEAWIDFCTDTIDSIAEIPYHGSDIHFVTDTTVVEMLWVNEKNSEYFFDTHSRNSLDDNIIALHSRIHYNNEYSNTDIVAHEMTHILTDYTSNLIYKGESGALNESFSDIFGDMIERYIYRSNDWIFDEDIFLESDKLGLRNIAVPPGDFNSDGIVELDDFLYLGLAKGFTGYSRPEATKAWILQDGYEWNVSTDGINSTYQDADGDGIVGEDDLDVLLLNYGESYDYFSYNHSTNPAIYTLREIAVDTIYGPKQIAYELYLQANTPINTHGISVSIELRDIPTISEIRIDTTGSVLHAHCIESYDSGNHTIEAALTLADESNQLIDGQIAKLIVMDKDVQVREGHYNMLISDTLHFALSRTDGINQVVDGGIILLAHVDDLQGGELRNELITGGILDIAQRVDEHVYFGLSHQRLYGDNSAALHFYSKHSNDNQFALKDIKGSLYGKSYGIGNGIHFGLQDGDGHWSYLANKDQFTAFRINNSEKMRILTKGNVGIGTNIPKNNLLAISGTIRAEEVKVELEWCNYVFNEDYKLLTLEEKEKYIEENCHLLSFDLEKNMSSKTQLGDTSKEQQAKIEEMKLRLIDLKKQINELTKELEALNTKVDK